MITAPKEFTLGNTNGKMSQQWRYNELITLANYINMLVTTKFLHLYYNQNDNHIYLQFLANNDKHVVIKSQELLKTTINQKILPNFHHVNKKELAELIHKEIQ